MSNKTKRELSNKEVLVKLLPFLKPYIPGLLATFLALILSTAVELRLPVILQKTVDKAIMLNNLDLLKRNSLIYLFLLLMSLGFTFFQVYFMNKTSQSIMKDIRMKVLSHIMKQPLGTLGKTPTGTYVSRVTSDVETLNDFFTSVSISIIKDITLMVGVLITLLTLNFKLGILTLLTLPPIFIFTLIFKKKALEAYRSQRSWIGKVNGYLAEHLSGIQIIQLFGKEKEIKDEFNSYNSSLLKANLKEMYINASFRPLIDLFTSITTGVIIYCGALFIGKNIISLGILIAFINLIQKFYRPVNDISEKFTILQSAMAGGERVFILLEEDNSLKDGKKTLKKETLGALEFKNVHFSYKQNEPILKGLNFKVKPGETLAIVGYTGAGKTTIASLAARFWDINSGEILLDQQNIKDLTLCELRQKIQGVQQDVFIFSGTVKENICLGSDYTQEEIEAACTLVQAHYFIKELPNGYNTILHENGSNLSAGQKQLLSFARTIIEKPAILILDEATAQIDTETEKIIQNALTSLLKGRTSLVIAHRLSTIQKADKIMVLSGGEVKEFGTHQELLELKGHYANLYNYQYKK